MATTIAKYRFDSESAYNSAKERIEREVGSYSSYGWDYYSTYYEISIYDTCEKATLIGQICRALGGSPYND
ncbi:MAG: hypothetical protein LBE13_22040 [Bacteroidales bacterium]|jgi:hypothetical protein|nr:hypothetical protein [Bacteroidales bacterium]